MLDGVGTFPVLLDVKFTVTPPVGATCVNVTVWLADRPKLTEGLLSVMPITLAVAVALVMPAALAVIVEEPATKLVTVTLADVALAANETVAGTVATLVVPEMRLTVNPPVGACPLVKFKVKIPELLVPTFKVDGENAIVGAVTVAVLVLVV